MSDILTDVSGEVVSGSPDVVWPDVSLYSESDYSAYDYRYFLASGGGLTTTEQSGWRSNRQMIDSYLRSGAALEAYREAYYGSDLQPGVPFEDLEPDIMQHPDTDIYDYGVLKDKLRAKFIADRKLKEAKLAAQKAADEAELKVFRDAKISTEKTTESIPSSPGSKVSSETPPKSPSV
jgi:hypothetical protein